MQPALRVRTHPGEILFEEFMRPNGLTSRQLAKQLGVPANRISELVRGRKSVMPDTAARLADRFGTTGLYWLNLQAAYDWAVYCEGNG